LAYFIISDDDEDDKDEKENDDDVDGDSEGWPNAGCRIKPQNPN